MSTTIAPLISNSPISSGVLTSRASWVAGAESTSVMPRAWSARNPGVPSRSTATTSPVTPSSRIASTVSCAHVAASAAWSS